MKNKLEPITCVYVCARALAKSISPSQYFFGSTWNPTQIKSCVSRINQLDCFEFNNYGQHSSSPALIVENQSWIGLRIDHITSLKWILCKKSLKSWKYELDIKSKQLAATELHDNPVNFAKLLCFLLEILQSRTEL